MFWQLAPGKHGADTHSSTSSLQVLPSNSVSNTHTEPETAVMIIATTTTTGVVVQTYSNQGLNRFETI